MLEGGRGGGGAWVNSAARRAPLDFFFWAGFMVVEEVEMEVFVDDVEREGAEDELEWWTSTLSLFDDPVPLSLALPNNRRIEGMDY